MTPQELVDELYDAVDNDDMCNRSYLVDEVEDLCAENAKLRELVRDMWPSYCWANTGYEAFLTHEQDVEIRDRIRELGIEINE